MGMVRTNITLPAELMALIDEVAGPRGRSAYIAEIVGKQARRDRARSSSRIRRRPEGLEDLGRDAGGDAGAHPGAARRRP